MVYYHPSIEILTDYASGSLPLTHSLSIATHLEHCSECQQHVRKLNLLGAHLFEQSKSDRSSMDSLKASFFDRLSAEDSSEAPLSEDDLDMDALDMESLDIKDTNATLNAGLSSGYHVPNSLRQFIPNGYDHLTWVSLSPFVKLATLYNETGGAQVALTRIKAGASIPTHTHTGNEITLVLEGAFSDKSGVYQQGDFINRDARHKHKPMVTKDAECICLTVLDSPIEFTGWFTRLLNPIMRHHHLNSHG